MNTVPVIESPKQLATYLAQAQTWSEIEILTQTYPDFKTAAWKQLSADQQSHILKLRDLKDKAIAQEFPLGCLVQRRQDPEQKQGTVIDHWAAYGVEYVVFSVDGFTDWCPGTMLEKMD
ncbi:hypothetical protein FLX56_25000 [Synechococcus moorigangaii CMS01]|nr:hypothetical protein [Synechococcus moorigangaii CMS01]